MDSSRKPASSWRWLRTRAARGGQRTEDWRPTASEAARRRWGRGGSARCARRWKVMRPAHRSRGRVGTDDRHRPGTRQGSPGPRGRTARCQSTMSAHGFVGDLLIREGLVDAQGLARGLEARAANGSTLGRALATLGLADESAVSATIASALHLEHLDGRAACRRREYLGAAAARVLPETPRRPARFRRRRAPAGRLRSDGRFRPSGRAVPDRTGHGRRGGHANVAGAAVPEGLPRTQNRSRSVDAV